MLWKACEHGNVQRIHQAVVAGADLNAQKDVRESVCTQLLCISPAAGVAQQTHYCAIQIVTLSGHLRGLAEDLYQLPAANFMHAAEVATDADKKLAWYYVRCVWAAGTTAVTQTTTVRL